MNYPILIILAFVGIVLQSTILHHVQVGGVTPDLILVLVVFHSIFQGPKRGAIFGFALGLMEDIMLGRFIGMNALAKGMTSLLVGGLAQRAFRENILVPIFTLFLGTLFNELIYLMLGKLTGLNWSWELWLWKAIPIAIYNTCLVPFVYSRFYYWSTGERENHAL